MGMTGIVQMVTHHIHHTNDSQQWVWQGLNSSDKKFTAPTNQLSVQPTLEQQG
jgi:hypothetical protein